MLEELLKNLNTKEALSSVKIGAKEFYELYKSGKAVLVDVRLKEESDFIGISGSLKIPLSELPERLSETPKDKLVATFCPGKIRSSFACAFLRLKGYDAKVLNAGLDDLSALLRP